MKELIIALQACLAVAVKDAKLSGEHIVLVTDHINSLEDLAIRNDAIKLIKELSHDNQHIKQDSAAGVLARVATMLTIYGSKPDAMLAVIHDKGWPEVTLADVEAVRKFILEQ